MKSKFKRRQKLSIRVSALEDGTDSVADYTIGIISATPESKRSAIRHALGTLSDIAAYCKMPLREVLNTEEREAWCKDLSSPSIPRDPADRRNPGPATCCQEKNNDSR